MGVQELEVGKTYRLNNNCKMEVIRVLKSSSGSSANNRYLGIIIRPSGMEEIAIFTTGGVYLDSFDNTNSQLNVCREYKDTKIKKIFGYVNIYSDGSYFIYKNKDNARTCAGQGVLAKAVRFEVEVEYEPM